jgi:hypothetical protein
MVIVIVIGGFIVVVVVDILDAVAQPGDASNIWISCCRIGRLEEKKRKIQFSKLS